MPGPKYYPILKWKKGEQTAVRHLSPSDQTMMLPLLEVIGPVEGSILAKLAASLTHAHAQQFPVGLDLRYLHPSGASLAALVKLCQAAQSAGFLAYPVVSAQAVLSQLGAPGQLAVLKGMAKVVLRLRLQLLTLPATASIIDAVRGAIGSGSELHVVFDFGPIGDVDPAALTTFVEPFVRAVVKQGAVNFVAIAGGSFPMSLAGMPVGIQNFLPRREWISWEQLRTKPDCTDVRFGDYNVTNPELLEIQDPSKMNPAAAIRYALDGKWWLLRAGGAKTGGFAQYNTLCKVLVADPRYYGSTFSFGDERYHYHAQPGATSGNFTTWRRDAASHHMVQTVRRLAQLI